MVDGLAALSEGYGAAYPALQQAVEAIPEPSVGEEDIAALMALRLKTPPWPPSYRITRPRRP